MIKMGKIVVSILSVLLLWVISYWGWQKYNLSQAETISKKPVASATLDTLHFPADAPQLAFVKVMTVGSYPEPLMDGLNARITYDDNYTARVFSPIAGRVLKVITEAGQKVRAGEPLLWIDSPDYAAGASDSLKANADLLRKKEAYERAKQLFDAKGLALKDLESAEADWRQAEAEAQRAKQRMKNLGSNAVKVASNKFILRAPINGLVSERQVNIGSEVRPDATTPLFIITNPEHVWVEVDLPEQQIGKIRVGQPVAVEVEAYPNESFSGKVAVIGEALDPVLHRFQVRCDVDNSQSKLKPEMFAHITPIVDVKSKLPRVPNTALFTQGLYSYIFVEQSPGVLQRRRVTLGMQDAEFSYIKEGVRDGERVVTAGALLLNSELSGNN